MGKNVNKTDNTMQEDNLDIKNDNKIEEKNTELYSEIIHFHIPRWNEFPDIDLYLDQISGLLEKYLSLYIRDEIKNSDKKNEKSEKNDDDKIITKAMISNYIKQKVLDPPINKKYTKIHIAKLFVISILKQIYSIRIFSFECYFGKVIH